MSTVLLDQHGRMKRKLRISLTDRCNFRCTYCMPERPRWLPKKRMLAADAMVRLASIFVKAGISDIRLTGGEPLLRPELADIVSALNQLRRHGLRRISITTNASLLADHMESLRRAGLSDLNISLDAIDPPRIRTSDPAKDRARPSRNRFGHPERAAREDQCRTRSWAKPS